MEQGSAAMAAAYAPEAERLSPAMVEAGTGAKLQHQWHLATWLAMSTAAAQFKAQHHMACRWISVGKSEVVASSQSFSSHLYGGRARHGSSQ